MADIAVEAFEAGGGDLARVAAAARWRNAYGKQPLFVAASEAGDAGGGPDCVRLLLAASPPSAITDGTPDGVGALEASVSGRHTAVFGILLQALSRDARVNAELGALTQAAKGTVAVAAGGAGSSALDGRTAMHWAAEEDHVAAIRWLLRATPSATLAQDAAGRTPLHHAARVGAMGALRELIDSLPRDGSGGAAAVLTFGAGWSPLHDAAHAGHVNAAAELLAAWPAAADAAARDGSTPLALAAAAGRSACVALLGAHALDTAGVDGAGAALRARNSTGLTPLHRASLAGHADAVGALLTALQACDDAADPPAAAARGVAVEPLRVWSPAADGLAARGASEAAPPQLEGALRDRSAAEGAWCGWTALGLAAGAAHLAVVRLLVAAGADPRARNPDGRTPVQAARAARGPGRDDCVGFLVWAASADLRARRGATRAAVDETQDALPRFALGPGVGSRAALLQLAGVRAVEPGGGAAEAGGSAGRGS